MQQRKGFLLVTMEPTADIEGEFKDWYDTEHVPERLAVPGFETATRYFCTAGWPRYLAFYDLTSPQVIESPGYRAISGERFSPWTRRILQRVNGFYRVFGEQAYREGLPGTHGRTLLLRARDVAGVAINDWVEGARRSFEARPDFRQLRVLLCASALGSDLLALVDFDASQSRVPPELNGFGALAQRLDLINEYVHIPRG